MILVSAALAFAMQAEASAEAVVIAVPPGPCRIFIDGKPTSFDHYRARVRKWKATQPEIRFEPGHAAEFKCIGRALRPLLEAKLTKIGFVGNEVEPQ